MRTLHPDAHALPHASSTASSMSRTRQREGQSSSRAQPAHQSTPCVGSRSIPARYGAVGILWTMRDNRTGARHRLATHCMGASFRASLVAAPKLDVYCRCVVDKRPVEPNVGHRDNREH
ncbi:hypothetical protein PsYK624_125510 [Phanerochaete sordida]|uniref:Uncharacterized protein n=1 Tax=Phanerochaete sordida TaxID=48140 RepID=A0A9P3LIB1_9APHY|nr:hypothetical protein PsYK624_125510 [Phanerochaete sordida]